MSPGVPKAKYQRVCWCGKKFSTHFVRQINCTRKHANLKSAEAWRTRAKAALKTVKELNSTPK